MPARERQPHVLQQVRVGPSAVELFYVHVAVLWVVAVDVGLADRVKVRPETTDGILGYIRRQLRADRPETEDADVPVAFPDPAGELPVH